MSIFNKEGGPKGLPNRVDLTGFCFELSQRIDMNMNHTLMDIRTCFIAFLDLCNNRVLDYMFRGKGFDGKPAFHEMETAKVAITNLMNGEYANLYELKEGLKKQAEFVQKAQEAYAKIANYLVRSVIHAVLAIVLLSALTVQLNWLAGVFLLVTSAVSGLYYRAASKNRALLRDLYKVD